MQKMMMNENELATRWNISPKTLQRWRSEGRGPRFMKMSKRVVYPIDEVFDFESKALRASTWEQASDVVLPSGSKLMDSREISYVTGLPLYIFTQKQMREALGIPHRRVQKLVRFDRDEVMVMGQALGAGRPRSGHRCEGRSRKPKQIVAARPGIVARLTAASAPSIYSGPHAPTQAWPPRDRSVLFRFLGKYLH
jgi:hypothetical protein